MHNYYTAEDDLSSKRRPPPGVAVGQTAGLSARPRDRENIDDYRWTGLVGFSSLVFKFSETTLANTFNNPVTSTGNEYTSPHDMKTYNINGQNKGLDFLGSYFFHTDVPGGQSAMLRPMPGVTMKLNNLNLPTDKAIDGSVLQITNGKNGFKKGIGSYIMNGDGSSNNSQTAASYRARPLSEEVDSSGTIQAGRAMCFMQASLNSVINTYRPQASILFWMWDQWITAINIKDSPGSNPKQTVVF